MSITYQWTIEELKKRLSVKLEPNSSNVSPNKIPVTTGIGSRAELKTIPIIGDWEYINTNFNFEKYKNYLVDTSTNSISGVLPLIPEDKMVIWIKDAKGSFSTNSLFILRHPSATYTINEAIDNLEIDLSNIDVFLIFDALNNNWIV